ncbi:MAG: DUF1385 domain-containing protein [Clostridia bacterium]|nr:DUF1385 domain-containing protein [Clostridia bacterium]
MKRSDIGGQAVMEGVMMKSPKGMALAVRRSDGSIALEYHRQTKTRKKGSFFTWPIIRGIVAFVESLVGGMKITTRSVELLGEEFSEEPSRFEKWLAKVFGKSVMDIAMAVAIVLAVVLALGLFVFLPQLLVHFIPGLPEGWRSLLEGVVRLLIFFAYIVGISKIKDIKRVFQYHGAEHKTIACYESDMELTAENAKACTRLHPRCGTNYLFLVMAISILVLSVASVLLSMAGLPMDNFIVRLLSRLILIPLIAGLSYEVLKGAAKSDNLVCRIVRAPGLALQRLTTKEPDEDMLEVAIASFKLAMEAPDHDIVFDEKKPVNKGEAEREGEDEKSPAEEKREDEGAGGD